MGRVWLEAATLAHTERAVPLSKIHSDLEKINPIQLNNSTPFDTMLHVHADWMYETYES